MPSFGHQYDPMQVENGLSRSSSAHFVNKNPLGNSYQRLDHNYPSNSNPTNQANRRNSLAKLNDFRKKVHQVIDLCAHQNTDVKTDFSQVVNEERKIYDMLIDNPSLLRRTVSHQNFPQVPLQMQQQTIPYNQHPIRQSQKPEQMTTPLGPKKSQKVPQSQYYIQSASQVAARQSNYPQSNSYFNAPKPQPGYLAPQFTENQFGQPTANLNSAENLQNLSLRLKSHSQIHLNPDLLQLIQEIEKKSSEELQRLRKQKLEIMQKLNQEIKNLNEEKKRNLQLQNSLARHNTQPQNPDGFNPRTQQNSDHLQSQINRLQEELQRSNQINHNLRLELSNRGAGVPGIEQLLRQGEAIGQETLRLIRLKQEGDGMNSRAQELQRRLHAQVMEKEAALNELRGLKERMGVSQVRTYEDIKLNEKSGIRNRASQPIKTVGQYEDLVSQMKRITGF